MALMLIHRIRIGGLCLPLALLSFFLNTVPKCIHLNETLQPFPDFSQLTQKMSTVTAYPQNHFAVQRHCTPVPQRHSSLAVFDLSVSIPLPDLCRSASHTARMAAASQRLAVRR